MRSIQKKSWKRKRPFLLLEVLVALTLVALCVFPLVYPHVQMIRAERKLSRTLDIDRAMGIGYVAVMEELFRNKVPWDSVEKKEQRPIDSEELLKQGFEGIYWMRKIPKKYKKGDPVQYRLLKLHLSLSPLEEGLEGPSTERQYWLFIEKKFTGSDDEGKKA